MVALAVNHQKHGFGIVAVKGSAFGVWFECVMPVAIANVYYHLKLAGFWRDIASFASGVGINQRVSAIGIAGKLPELRTKNCRHQWFV